MYLPSFKQTASGHQDVVPTYFYRDDTIDEDGFKVLIRDEKGCGSVVSEVPKDTRCSFLVKRPYKCDSISEWIRNLIRCPSPHHIFSNGLPIVPAINIDALYEMNRSCSSLLHLGFLPSFVPVDEEVPTVLIYSEIGMA
ncbi:hypothetical protein ACFE04_015093 [Oxalis oulophora]